MIGRGVASRSLRDEALSGRIGSSLRSSAPCWVQPRHMEITHAGNLERRQTLKHTARRFVAAESAFINAYDCKPC